MSRLTPPHINRNTDPSSAAEKRAITSPSNSTGVAKLPLSNTQRRLILALDGKILREIPITNSMISIGRKHGNDIQLNDLTLSGRHAQITSVPDYVFIEDLGSTNGTLVNGNHVKKVALEPGDVIEIGHHQLTYMQPLEKSCDPTMFVQAESDKTQFTHEKVSAPFIVKGLALGGFRTVNGSSKKPLMELRKTYNSVGFQGKRVALITRSSDGYYITSVLGTRNRRATDVPQLNGEVLGTKFTLLKENDIVKIAGFEIQFYFLT